MKIKRLITKDPDKVHKIPKAKKIKKIKKYPKQKCVVPGCKKNAVGKGDTCKKHKGNPIIEENLIPAAEASSYMLKGYNKKYPMLFIKKSIEGLSEVEIAAELGVGTTTIRKWAETFEEFAEAYEVGNAAYEAWWLREGKNNLGNNRYNTRLYTYITMNKLGYSDKVESKNLHVHAGVLRVPEEKSIDEWEKEVEKSKGY